MGLAKKTLLIGGAGFIGRNMVPFLNAEDREVTIIGRSALNNADLKGNVNYIQGDFNSLAFISPLVESHDEIVHLAYASSPNTSFDKPLDDLRENLLPSVQLFIEIAKFGKKLVFISSGGTVYGEQKSELIDESHSTHPISPYGLTKITLENYAFLYGVTHGLNFTIVRPTNAYGIGQDSFSGQGFVAAAVAAAKQGKSIQVYGKSGTVRDYIYVTDLAKGIVEILKADLTERTYNISTGVGYSNLDIVNKLNKILIKYNTKLNVTPLPARPFDVKSNILDNKRMRQHTAWSPTIDIDKGLALVVDNMFKKA